MDLLERQRTLAERIQGFERVHPLAQQNSEGQIQSTLELLQEYWSKFKKVHDEVTSIPELQDEQESLQQIFNDVQRDFVKTKGQLYDERSRFSAMGSQSISGRSRDTESYHKEAHNSCNNMIRESSIPLQRISVPTFSGKREEWESFRDLFQAVIHDKSRLSAIEKFHYLRMSLAGEAKIALHGIPTTADGYQIAWNRLLSRYDNKELLLRDHIGALLAMPTCREESSNAVQVLQDALNHHREALRNLNQPVETWDIWFCYLAEKSMDVATRRDWEKEQESELQPSSFAKLNVFLNHRIRILKSTELINKSKPKNVDNGNWSKGKSNKSYSTVFATQYERQCSVCDDNNHVATHCKKLTALEVSERKALARKKGLCYNCLGKGHDVQKCPSNGVCKICKGRHHTLLHIEKRKSIDLAENNKIKQPKLTDQGKLSDKLSQFSS